MDIVRELTEKQFNTDIMKNDIPSIILKGALQEKSLDELFGEKRIPGNYWSPGPLMQMFVKLISTLGFVKLISGSTFNRLEFNFAIEESKNNLKLFSKKG